MGIWASHTFIQTTDMAALERAVEQVLAVDGYEPIPKPTPDESLERRTYGDGERLYLRKGFCGVLLIPATSRDQKWSYIQCVLKSLLCKRSQGISNPKLVDLAKILQVDAFRLEVEDGDSAVLLECKDDGSFRLSGALTSMCEEAYSDYTDEIIEETEHTPVMYFEEEVQAEEPEFELLSNLKAFSPVNFECIESAANEIEAEFLGSLDSDLDWIFMIIVCLA